MVHKEDDGPESLTWENEWLQTDQVCFSKRTYLLQGAENCSFPIS